MSPFVDRDLSGRANESDSDLMEYLSKYDGFGRLELIKADRPLYKRLKSKGLLHRIEVKNPSDKKHFNAIESGAYEGLTRGKIKTIDPSFYMWLWRNSLLALYPSRAEMNQNL
jgi:hypothetical protein